MPAHELREPVGYTYGFQSYGPGGNVFTKSPSCEVVDCDLQSIVWGCALHDQLSATGYAAPERLKKLSKNRKDLHNMPCDYPWVCRVLALMGPVNCPCASCDRVITMDSTRFKFNDSNEQIETNLTFFLFHATERHTRYIESLNVNSRHWKCIDIMNMYQYIDAFICICVCIYCYGSVAWSD